MTSAHKCMPALALVCGSLLLTTACAATMRPPGGRLGPRSNADAVTNGPSEDACKVELPALVTRLARLERERTRIHDGLARAGFARTSAEAIGDGTAAPGLALEAARSADALEKLLADRTLMYPGLNAEIDWIASNWFDPDLMRWTSAQIRALASMTAEVFREAKADTMGLRAILPEIAAAKRRQAALAACGSRKVNRDEPGPVPNLRLAAPPLAAGPVITCNPRATTTVQCQESVVVAANDVSALRPLNSSSMTRDELRGLGPDASSWMAFVRNTAGVSDGIERVYVEGMPAAANLPAAMIGRITVNGDPFSSEYSNVGELRINVDLIAPERRWRAGLSSPSFGVGGGSPLGPTGSPISRSASMSVSGPVPKLPVTFSMHASQRFDARRPLFVAPGSGALAPADVGVLATSSGADFVMGAAFVTTRGIARATFSDSRMGADHAGIGGTNGPTTGQRLDSRNRRLQSSWRAAIDGRIHRGGLSFARDRLSSIADSLAPAVIILEELTGGDELATNHRQSDAWLAKHVVESGGGKWTAGVEGRSERVSDERTPNPHGRIQFSGLEARTATWILTRGGSATAARISSTALFAETLTVNTPRVTLRSGLRLDWQSRAGVFVSPRVAASARFAGFQVTGGAGLFVQAWSPDLFVLAALRDGTRGTTFVVHDVPVDTIERIDPANGDRLRAAIAPGFAPRRDLITRAGIRRRFGLLQTGVEHTWTRGESLPGGERQRDADGRVDVLNSDRGLRRHQTHVRSSFGRGADHFSAYYQHVWSFDDSDGPFVPPARQGDVSGEWARSAGVARHAAGITGTTRLPAEVRLFLTVEARAGVAYTVLTGLDPDALAVFADRGGRPRNAGTLPPLRKISLSLSRTMRIPRAAWLAFDVGIRADNVTNHLNVTSVGRVVGAPSFGQPIDAAAGRSVRLWASLAR